MKSGIIAAGQIKFFCPQNNSLLVVTATRGFALEIKLPIKAFHYRYTVRRFLPLITSETKGKRKEPS